ncbi:MAG: hypothetical protein ACTSRP_17640 [Candidatus Helarchaeota archaeon]
MIANEIIINKQLRHVNNSNPGICGVEVFSVVLNIQIGGADFTSESYSQEIYDEIVWKININNITGSSLIPNYWYP